MPYTANGLLLIIIPCFPLIQWFFELLVRSCFLPFPQWLDLATFHRPFISPLRMLAVQLSQLLVRIAYPLRRLRFRCLFSAILN